MLHYYTFPGWEPERLKISHPLGRAALLLLFAFTGHSARAADAPLHIVATIKPLQLLVQAVVGDAATVDVLLDPRVSPHDYQLRPSDRGKLDRADVVFWVGPSMETFMVPVLGALGERTRLVAWQRDKAASGDPHRWMDPLESADMAGRIAGALGELAPAYKSQWQANATRVANSLRAEDEHLRDRLAAIAQPRGYLVAHDAYGRLEQRYGLRHVAALTDNADLPPGARHIAQIETALDAGRITCVLREPSTEPKVLQTLLKNRGVRVVTIDSMASGIAPSDHGIVDFYRQLGIAMGDCLQP